MTNEALVSNEDLRRGGQLHTDSIVINALNSTWFTGLTDEYIKNLHASGVTASNITINYIPWSGLTEAFQTMVRARQLADRQTPCGREDHRHA